jgi:hypothetical protein
MQLHLQMGMTSEGGVRRVMRSSRRLLCLALLLLATSCATVKPGALPEAAWQKVELDLSQLDSDGLRGNPGGKVSMAYEFAIPDTDICRERVRTIDPTVRFMSQSRGRIGAGEDECLCIGETHQANYRAVLGALSSLPCVTRIIECHFE